jgi:dihydrofolate synthase / folylpolyglutamate synthase
MQVNAIKTRVFKESENLADFISHHIPKLKNYSILVITSKIVALAENRTVEKKSKAQKIRLIKQESTCAIKARKVWVTIIQGQLMPSAGIDESNANGKYILLPKNSYVSATKIRRKLLQKYRIKNLGIIISDSRTLPLRAGTIGTALGYAGFKGIKDYQRKKDIFGRKFVYSRSNLADSLSASAVLQMGEGSEQKPLCVITSAPVIFTNTTNPNELKIKLKDDMYFPLLKLLK